MYLSQYIRLRHLPICTMLVCKLAVSMNKHSGGNTCTASLWCKCALFHGQLLKIRFCCASTYSTASKLQAGSRWCGRHAPRPLACWATLLGCHQPHTVMTVLHKPAHGRLRHEYWPGCRHGACSSIDQASLSEQGSCFSVVCGLRHGQKMSR